MHKSPNQVRVEISDFNLVPLVPFVHLVLLWLLAEEDLEHGARVDRNDEQSAAHVHEK